MPIYAEPVFGLVYIYNDLISWVYKSDVYFFIQIEGIWCN